MYSNFFDDNIRLLVLYYNDLQQPFLSLLMVVMYRDSLIDLTNSLTHSLTLGYCVCVRVYILQVSVNHKCTHSCILQLSHTRNSLGLSLPPCARTYTHYVYNTYLSWLFFSSNTHTHTRAAMHAYTQRTQLLHLHLKVIGPHVQNIILSISLSSSSIEPLSHTHMHTHGSTHT